MRSSASLFAVTVLSAMTLASAVCSAQQTQNPRSSMEERQQACNAEASAKNLAGDPRKAFMSDCLSGGGSGTSTGNTQERLEQACNTTANGRHLTGEDRQGFMARCLKGQ